MPPLIDLRRVRGHLLLVLQRAHRADPGRGMRTAVLESVLRALYPGLTETEFKGQLQSLQEWGLVDPLSDDSVPLEFQDLTESVKLTRAGKAVADGDAAMTGILLAD